MYNETTVKIINYIIPNISDMDLIRQYGLFDWTYVLLAKTVSIILLTRFIAKPAVSKIWNLIKLVVKLYEKKKTKHKKRRVSIITEEKFSCQTKRLQLNLKLIQRFPKVKLAC